MPKHSDSIAAAAQHLDFGKKETSFSQDETSLVRHVSVVFSVVLFSFSTHDTIQHYLTMTKNHEFWRKLEKLSFFKKIINFG